LWSLEPTLDGRRTLVYVDDGLTVRTRTGRDISRQTPELAGSPDRPVADAFSTGNSWLARVSPVTSTVSRGGWLDDLTGSAPLR